MKLKKNEIMNMAHDGKTIRFYVCQAMNWRKNCYSTFEEAVENMRKNKSPSAVFLAETYRKMEGDKVVEYGINYIGDPLAEN